MARLALTVPHGPDEAPHGFLGRTAARNGVAAAGFCLQMGLDLVRIANGDDRDIGLLASLTGADVGALRGNALVARTGKTWTLGGEAIDHGMVRRLDARVCPLCIAADAAAHRGPPSEAARCRSSWLIAQIRTCPVHAVALVGLRQAGAGSGGPRPSPHDFVGRLEATWGQDGPGSLPIRRTYVSGLEAYLAARLAGARDHEWLDAMPFDVVATFAERLGVAALLGPEALLTKLDDDDWKAAGDAGWEVVRQGPAGLARLAAALGRWTEPAADAAAGYAGSFGRFWPFVLRASSKPAYRPLCLTLASHLGDLRPALPARLVPDGETAGRRGYRLSTAAVEHRRSPGALKGVLSRHGAIGPDQKALAPRHVVLDREAVGEAMRELDGRITLAEAGRRLQAPGRQAGILHAAGLLGPVPAQRRRGRNLTVDAGDVDALLRDLARGAEERIGPVAGEAGLLDAARSARRSLGDVARLVVDGRLGWVGRTTGVRGLPSVLVRVAEVRALLEGCRAPGATIAEAARLLRVGYAGVRALVADGHLVTEAASQGRNGQALILVTRPSLDRFRREYASVSAIAARWSVHPHAARSILAARGVASALSVERYGTPIHRACEVPDAR